MQAAPLRGDEPELPEVVRARFADTVRPPALRPGKPCENWASKALRQEASAVESAPEGERNDCLNRAAFNLGQIVAGGSLDESEVEACLLGAALKAGPDEAPGAQHDRIRPWRRGEAAARTCRRGEPDRRRVRGLAGA